MVADYGYHSTVIVPRADGRLVEYAFGDHSYFGQNDKSFLKALHALFLSDQATLGRRLIEPIPPSVKMEDATGALTIVRIDAPKEKVSQLERDLDVRFIHQIDTVHWSDVHNLYFVKDAQPYSLKNNCNVETARWLEKIGCRIQGCVVGSQFTLAEPPAE